MEEVVKMLYLQTGKAWEVSLEQIQMVYSYSPLGNQRRSFKWNRMRR